MGFLKRIIKDKIKEEISSRSPKLGEAVENIDRGKQTIKNFVRSNYERGYPHTNMPTTIPDYRTLKNDLCRTKVRDSLKIEMGDHLLVERFGYEHHAIYFKNNEVIHFSEGIIKVAPLEEFRKSAQCFYVVHTRHLYNPDEIITRAFSRLHEEKYNVITNNCEHFVNWCRNGHEFEYWI